MGSPAIVAELQGDVLPTMAQNKIIRRGGSLYIYSFTTGVQSVQVPVRKTENDVMAELMRLVRNGKAEEAELLLEWYCSSR